MCARARADRSPRSRCVPRISRFPGWMGSSSFWNLPIAGTDDTHRCHDALQSTVRRSRDKSESLRLKRYKTYLGWTLMSDCRGAWVDEGSVKAEWRVRRTYQSESGLIRMHEAGWEDRQKSPRWKKRDSNCRDVLFIEAIIWERMELPRDCHVFFIMEL